MDAQWKTITFGEAVDVAQGLAFNKKNNHLMVDQGIPLLRITDLIQNTESKFVDAMKVQPKFIAKREDIIFSRTGQVGLVFRGRIGVVHNNCFRVIPRTGFDPDYVYWYLRQASVIDQARALASGAAQPDLGHDAFRSIPFRYPERLESQRRIAGILSAYEGLIENSQRRIQILEAMSRALYREWFVDFRFPGHEMLPRVPSPLGMIPNGWEVKPLEAVCSRITDGAHRSPPSVDQGYPMASVKDMNDWGIRVENCRRIGARDYEDLVRNNCRPVKNDVLIAKDGSYLKHVFVLGAEQELVILSSIAILRPNSAVLPNYLSFTLREPTTKARMSGFVSGVAVPRIVLKDFRRFLVLVPPAELQALWARHTDPQVEMCRNLTSQVQNLRQTRDLQLPRLLLGQVTLIDTAA